MRLINTHTYELSEFQSRPDEGYIALSHRWEAEEISFNQFQDSTYMRLKGKKTAGWKKIKKSCDMAAMDGVKWVWVDTCCIDKSSSAELSETINSMYKLYRDSVACFAYLSDTDRSLWITDGKPSLWFSRGWTLQELLAPRKVLFYDRNWRYLGTKKGLCDSILEITNIPLHFLYPSVSSYMNLASVAQKMSWTQDRYTSRDEDMAYCLLGLFNVNMPLLYGEGVEKAFKRLQLAIIHEIDDESIFASRPQLSSPRTLLADHPHSFKLTNVISAGGSLHSLPNLFSETNRGSTIRKKLYPIAANIGRFKAMDTPNVLERISPDSEILRETMIAPLNCLFNGKTIGILLFKSPGVLNAYIRIDLCLIEGDLEGEIESEILVLGKAFFESTGFSPFGLKSKSLRRELQKIFMENPEASKNNPYGLDILDFHLEERADQDSLSNGVRLLFKIPRAGANGFPIRKDFAAVIRELNLPSDQAEDLLDRADTLDFVLN